MAIKFNSGYSKNIVSSSDIEAMAPKAEAALNTLLNGTGEGNDFRGWLNLPSNCDEFDEIVKAADYIKKNAEALISEQELLLRL